MTTDDVVDERSGGDPRLTIEFDRETGRIRIRRRTAPGTFSRTVER
jgi:hypothetical protein